MLRGENIVCGTSTTGTGTLTLAACPSPPGGVDFDAWLKATGIGFVSGNALLVSYTIIEYADSTFATAKFVEKGIGTLTLGASITAATLARTTVQTVSNANADSYQVGGGASAITIGTAANVLVFVGASAADVPACLPYFSTANDNIGSLPVGVYNTSGNLALTTAKEVYSFFEWRVPMLVKRATIRVGTAYATGSPVSNADARLYAINSSAQPGKLLYDFGLLGTSNTSLNSTGNVSTGAAGNGFYLMPGEYVFSFCPVYSGGSTTPAILVSGTVTYGTGRFGSSSMVPLTGATATSGTIGAAPDPANVTGYASTSGTSTAVLFALAPS